MNMEPGQLYCFIMDRVGWDFSPKRLNEQIFKYEPWFLLNYHLNGNGRILTIDGRILQVYNIKYGLKDNRI